jgi:hypothetical protein
MGEVPLYNLDPDHRIVAAAMFPTYANAKDGVLFSVGGWGGGSGKKAGVWAGLRDSGNLRILVYLAIYDSG